MPSRPDEASPETHDALLDVHCPSCGRLWHDPGMSGSLPGSGCDIGECLCAACETGECDAPHAEDRALWARYWRRSSPS